MQTQPAFLHFARNLFIRGMAPLGANRADGFLRDGLPSEFRPALDFLFSGKLSAEDRQVVARVESLRAAFALRTETFEVYGVAQTKQPRTAPELATTASVTQQWGTFLYLCSKGFRADSILELGSCIGISGSYLASAPGCRQMLSIERSTDVALVAQAHLHQILPQAQVINRPIDDTLPQVLERFQNGIQLYYVDAFHSYEPTLRFFEQAMPFLRRGALVVFDDIHWSKEMWDAWLVLRARQGFSHTVDVGRFGLCVWQGGAVTPKQYDLAKYAGWLWKYASR